MDNLESYTIINKYNNKFMNSNMFCDDTFNVVRAIQFLTKDRAEKYLNGLSSGNDNYKIAKITYNIEF